MSRLTAEHPRVLEAYLRMAKAGYRAARRDTGTYPMSETELGREAKAYAIRFVNEENLGSFHIGCSDYSTNRALVYTIEAARLCCGGGTKHDLLAMLELAQAEVQELIQQEVEQQARHLRSRITAV